MSYFLNTLGKLPNIFTNELIAWPKASNKLAPASCRIFPEEDGVGVGVDMSDELAVGVSEGVGVGVGVASDVAVGVGVSVIEGLGLGASLPESFETVAAEGPTVAQSPFIFCQFPSASIQVQ